MTETNHDRGSSSPSASRPIEESMATPDVHNAAMKIKRAREAYRAYTGIQDKPTKLEIWLWYLYGLCSYFLLTTLVPVVFPLIISQIENLPEPGHGWGENSKGVACWLKELQLYERLTHRSISVNNMNFSSLEWTSISWVLGLILATPFAGLISTHLDFGFKQKLIAGAATAIGSLFCLPVGFFKNPYIFPLYIAVIVSSYIISSASHTRHLGLIIHGFIGSNLQISQFPIRRDVSGWFSLYATAAGCLGSAIISAFTYHMLRYKKDRFASLWIVSIFSGLKWLVGIFHVVAIRPGAVTATSSLPKTNFLTLFKYPHALGSLIVVLLSSFTSMCIFSGGMLHLLGQLCLKPTYFLYVWLIYFIFPLFSMPLLQPLQHVIKADAVRMQLLGLFLAVFTSGMGYCYREKNWLRQHVLIFAAIQSTSTGLLHAFGRVLLLDCTPHDTEGAFSVWFSWVKALGTCAGFAMASAVPGNVSTAFGVSFCSAMIGILTLIFGNISDVGGAKAAGHLHDSESERGSPVHGLDTSTIKKESVHEDTA